MTRKQSQSFLGTPATAPGPQGPDMLRDFSLIRSNPLAFLEKSWRTYGDVVQFPIPRPPTYLVNSPAGIRQVLVSHGRNYGKSTIQYRALSLVTGEGLLTADNDNWRKRRPMIQPAFHQALFTELTSITQGVAESLAAEWKQVPAGAVCDVDQFMLTAALDVVGQFLFGADLSTNAHTITEATLEALDVVIARARVPIAPPGWVPTTNNRKLNRSVAALDAAVEAMVSSQRLRGVIRNQVDGEIENPRNMIELLSSTIDPDGTTLSMQEIRDEIVTFIVAGHETVASALSWSWAILADNPDLQDRLAAEAQQAGESNGGASIDNLPLTRAFFEEVLRMYPPAWLITRKALGPDTIDGHEIPAGALIILSPALIHQHPDAWPNAHEFDAERFLREYPRESFIPFGAGLRQCIGKDFAYIEGVLLLAQLTRQFAVSYPAGGRIPVGEPLVTIRPRGGVRVHIRARSH